jgi:hypothetical protein
MENAYMDHSKDLIFHDQPELRMGTLTFRRVPTILQFEDVPIIEMRQKEHVGWSTRFHIYHPDGTSLAVVKGSHLFPTEDGKKAGLKLRHFPNLTICELDGQTLLELRFVGPAALSASAELYTPTGMLIKSGDALECFVPHPNGFTAIHGREVRDVVFEDCPVAIKLWNNGTMDLRVSLTPDATFAFISGDSVRLVPLPDDDTEPSHLLVTLQKKPDDES